MKRTTTSVALSTVVLTSALAVSLPVAAPAVGASATAAGASAVAAVAAVAGRAGAVDPLLAPLPLGPAGLAESRTVEQLAPGVSLHKVLRGQVDPDDVYTVSAGFATTEAEAVALEDKVRAAGFEPRRDASSEPSPLGPDSRPLGWTIRTGAFATKAEGDALLPALRRAGLSPRTDDTAHDGHLTDGPWRVTMLVVDPRTFTGSMRSVLATDEVFGRETTSAVAERLDALAAVNGGFFTIDGTRDVPGPWLEGTDGDLGGIAVVDGDLVSEAVGDRPALVLRRDGGRAEVRRLVTPITVSAPGASHEVTGLNRTPGLVTNCGGVGTVSPVTGAQHDYTCGNDNELVAFGPEFGTTLPTGAGFQVRLDAQGTVTEVSHERGGLEPATGTTVLQATGAAAAWLVDHAEPGVRLTVRERVQDSATGAVLGLTPDTSVMNGGPLLLDEGKVVLDPVRDGWSPAPIAGAARADFYWRWYVRRNPRTAAGVLADGRVVFVQVDGRQPGRSVGLSITETAAVMRSLGAVDAINLDGGGSSAVVTEDGLVNTPSDPVERPVADAIVLTR